MNLIGQCTYSLHAYHHQHESNCMKRLVKGFRDKSFVCLLFKCLDVHSVCNTRVYIYHSYNVSYNIWIIGIDIKELKLGSNVEYFVF